MEAPLESPIPAATRGPGRIGAGLDPWCKLRGADPLRPYTAGIISRNYISDSLHTYTECCRGVRSDRSDFSKTILANFGRDVAEILWWSQN